MFAQPQPITREEPTLTREEQAPRENGVASSKKTLRQIFDHREGFHFWNNTLGSFMDHGAVNPVLSAAKGGKFRINCLESESYIRKAERSEEIVSLRVSIQLVRADGTEGGYLSCRKKCLVTGSSLAEYRSTVGVMETFDMVHSRADNSYLFKSHNYLYLHCNHTFHSVAFKTCSERSQHDVFPVKGRWDILADGESDRAGKHSGYMSMAKEVAFAPVKIPATAVKGLFYMAGE